jgi:hypothetical protein
LRSSSHSDDECGMALAGRRREKKSGCRRARGAAFQKPRGPCVRASGLKEGVWSCQMMLCVCVCLYICEGSGEEEECEEEAERWSGEPLRCGVSSFSSSLTRGRTRAPRRATAPQARAIKPLSLAEPAWGSADGPPPFADPVSPFSSEASTRATPTSTPLAQVSPRPLSVSFTHDTPENQSNALLRPFLPLSLNSSISSKPTPQTQPVGARVSLFSPLPLSPSMT